jgi:membrane fusion protein YbhG
MEGAAGEPTRAGRRRALAALAAAAVLLAAAFGLFRLLGAGRALPEGLLYANGRLEAVDVRVSAEVTGRVVESRLLEGTRVEAGDLLVRLDDAELATTLAEAQARRQALESVRERLVHELETWRHHLGTARSELDRARELELFGLRLAKTRIRAPIGGTVLVRGIEVGELAAPGRLVAELADLDELELRVFVPEREVGKVRLDAPARVRVDAFPERAFAATVKRVDAEAQFTPREVHMPEEWPQLAALGTLLFAAGSLRFRSRFAVPGG